MRLCFVVGRMVEDFFFSKYAVALAVEGKVQGKRSFVNARKTVTVDVLVPRHKGLFSLDRLREKGLVVPSRSESAVANRKPPFCSMTLCVTGCGVFVELASIGEKIPYLMILF